MNAGLIFIICSVGAIAGFWLGVLVMALAQIRTRAEELGDKAYQDWLKSEDFQEERGGHDGILLRFELLSQGRSVDKLDELMRLAALDASLNRVTDHLNDYATRGPNGQS